MITLCGQISVSRTDNNHTFPPLPHAVCQSKTPRCVDSKRLSVYWHHTRMWKHVRVVPVHKCATPHTTHHTHHNKTEQHTETVRQRQREQEKARRETREGKTREEERQEKRRDERRQDEREQKRDTIVVVWFFLFFC